MIIQLFQRMQIDGRKLLYGLDHIGCVCRKTDLL